MADDILVRLRRCIPASEAWADRGHMELMRLAIDEIETLRATIAHMEMHLVPASDVDAACDRLRATLAAHPENT